VQFSQGVDCHVCASEYVVPLTKQLLVTTVGQIGQHSPSGMYALAHGGGAQVLGMQLTVPFSQQQL